MGFNLKKFNVICFEFYGKEENKSEPYSKIYYLTPKDADDFHRISYETEEEDATLDYQTDIESFYFNLTRDMQNILSNTKLSVTREEMGDELTLKIYDIQ